MINLNISMSLDRADELASEMEREHRRSLDRKAVSARAIHLTHEVCERLRSVLDRLARAYWEKRISPVLTNDDREAAAVYFPIVRKEQGFDAVMGRWRWKAIKLEHQEIYDYLRSLQPFSNVANGWLVTLNELSLQSKHIDLVPQKRTEDRRTVVTGPQGEQVAWGANEIRFGIGGGLAFGPGGEVSFGPNGPMFSGNIAAIGAPIDPLTQRIRPTLGHTDRVEIWIGFEIEGFNVDAMKFCRDARKNVRRIAADMTDRFDL